MARVLINHRIPDSVEVADLAGRVDWYFLSVASHVAFWITVVNLSHAMQRLMDIAEVVNH